jgi:hypothetical protein
VVDGWSTDRQLSLLVEDVSRIRMFERKSFWGWEVGKNQWALGFL